MFLFFACLHAWLSFLLCALYAIIVSRTKLPEIFQEIRTNDDPSKDHQIKFHLVLQVFNVIVGMNVLCLGGLLFNMAKDQHDLIMSGTTTNEFIRQKWNATLSKEKQIQVSTRAKLHHLYWASLPESKVERFYRLRQ